MNTQLNYYTTKKINPVEIPSGGSQWQQHFEQRKNLIEQHLKIPLSWFKGKNILEFGPNKGEHAVILAELGANITLVEPNHLMHNGIKENFQKNKLEHKLNSIHSSTLENFELDEKFDIVWAEGFLHALENRGDLIQKLCSHSTDKVIYTYSDQNGYFFESFKRYLFKKVIETQEINNKDWSKIYMVAKLFFLKPFLKLNSSRSFESWVRDVIINPCQVSNSLDNFQDLIKYSDKTSFSYFSGSPSWDQRNNYKWYKNISNNSIEDEYHKNISFFITGKVDNNLTISDINKINQLTNYFIDYSSNVHVENIIDNFKFPSKFPFMEIQQILTSIYDFEKLLELYETSEISNIWGMPNHHVCLTKS